jgi:hypothetical protein
VSVTLVLDTSAATAYMRESLAVGELIGMIADDDDTAVLPAVCLAEAAAAATDKEQLDMLRLLSVLPGIVVAPLRADRAVNLGARATAMGSLGMAHAVSEALLARAQFGTTDGAAARRILPTYWDILEL